MIKENIKSVILKSGLFKHACKFRGKSIAILRYHSVQDEPSRYANSIGETIIHSTDVFREQMVILRRDYNLIDMDEVYLYLTGQKKLEKNSVAITFDDGFLDNKTIAAPILNELGIKAAFYVITDSVGGDVQPWFVRIRHAFSSTKVPRWEDNDGNIHVLEGEINLNNARLAATKCAARITGKQQSEYIARVVKELRTEEMNEKLMMDWDDVSELDRQGHIIGSHTHTHPNLAYIQNEELETELKSSKLMLEEKLKKSVLHLAYPNPILTPNWNKDVIKVAEQLGYHSAVTCDAGNAVIGDQILGLKRLAVPEISEGLLWAIENAFLGRIV